MPEVRVDLSPQAITYLDALVDTGLYGFDREEIASRLIDRGLIQIFFEKDTLFNAERQAVQRKQRRRGRKP